MILGFGYGVHMSFKERLYVLGDSIGAALALAALGLVYSAIHRVPSSEPPAEVRSVEQVVVENEFQKGVSPFDQVFLGPINLGRAARENFLAQYKSKNEERSVLEKEIEAAWHVRSWGMCDNSALLRIKETLSHMPVVDPCDVYVLPVATTPKNLFGENGGLYEPSTLGFPDHIILWQTDPVTITHEWAHKRAAVLGSAAEEKFGTLNRFPYGSEIVQTQRGYTWKDGGLDIRDGFCEPYARKNVQEDIATHTAFVRHKMDNLYLLQLRIDEESAHILSSKVELLERGNFIHPAEATRARRYLHQERIKHDFDGLKVLRAYKPDHIRYGNSPIYTSGAVRVFAQKTGEKATLSIVYDPDNIFRGAVNPSHLWMFPVPTISIDLDKGVSEKYQRFLPPQFINWVDDFKRHTK